MPIRMTDDPNAGSGSNTPPRPSRPGGGGGGNPIVYMLPKLLGFLFRNPKIGIPLVLIGGAFLYFSGGLGGLFSGTDAGFATGANLDPKEYEKAQVYEPLAEGGNQLPEKISLLNYAPDRLNQGQQGSCVGWASSYAARTILEAKKTGKDPNEIRFSPSFLYNQIALKGCNGTYLNKAMEVLENVGDVSLRTFPYDENTCSNEPGGNIKQSASQFKIKGATRLSVDSDDFKVNVNAVREHLASGGPVVIGMMVGGSFMREMEGKSIWQPTRSDYNRVNSFGGHAMCVIGYNVMLEGGAFQIMNSWGPEWGEKGIGWVKYEDFNYFVREAFGMYNMGDAVEGLASQEILLGLVEFGTSKNMDLKKTGEFTFQTKIPIRKGSRFKVSIENKKPTYIYIFGQETDGSSYVLFPYSEQHAAYCGTTGTRIFPRKQSLTADEKGNKDFIAIVISAKEQNYNQLNTDINSVSSPDYARKVSLALGNKISHKSAISEKNGHMFIQSEESNPDFFHIAFLEFEKR